MATEAVIFDCDGTLVDSVPLAAEVLVEYLADLGVGLSVDDATKRFGSGRLAESIVELENFLGCRLPEDFEAELRRRRNHAVRAQLRPIEGAHDLLRGLQIPVAVASNGPLEQTRLSLELTGLLQYFSDNVVSAYELNSWKPEPHIFLHVARVLGVHPSRCAVVEDAIPGIEAGVAAGMTVFALCEDNRRWKLDQVVVVRHLDEIRHHLIGAA
jgi:HAD superfamily hydrolase (TIGR01509 family)